MIINLPIFLLCMMFFTSLAYGDQSCDSYPYTINQLIYTKYDDRINVTTTCSVSVDFFDIDDQMDSMKNAELLAKIELARFLYREKEGAHHKQSGSLAILCDNFEGSESKAQFSFTYKLQRAKKISSCYDEKRSIASFKVIHYR